MKKNIFYIFIILSFVFTGFTVKAEDTTPTDPITPNLPVEEQPADPVPTPDPEPVPVLGNVFIRNGSAVVYSGDVALPSEGNIEILDSAGVSRSVNARSVLGLLYSLDQSSESFSLSNLQYYDSFSSFYLKCVTVDSTIELCDNWQYVVGGTSPWTSIDATILSGGESIALYFGSPYKIDLDSNSVTTSGSINAKAQSYNYLEDSWVVRTGVAIGITQMNPNDPWNPNVVSVVPVDENGNSNLSFPSAGSYNVGISEDYYFPSYAVSVSEPSSSGGSSSVPVVASFSKDSAISFLNSNKKSDGSFGSSLYTDWVAVAFGSTENTSLVSSLSEYLKLNNLNSNIATDNERRAMALMSLGINPYDGTGVNYISKIIEKFDGSQIGDVNLDNDDIFGIIVLKKAGYSYSDDVISKSIDFVKTKQYSNGSWDNSVDMTSAAIMALYPFKNKDGISDSIDKAFEYLINSQSSDGRIGDNVSSTSWAVQAISLKSDLVTPLANARVYIASQQKSDGGVGDVGGDIDSRLWATSYAVTSESLKSWIDIMLDFEKPVIAETRKTTSENTIQVIPTVDTLVVQDNKVTINENLVEAKKEIKKEDTKKQVKETKKIISEVKNENVEKLPLDKSNLIASASDSGISLKIPSIAKVIWKNIATFFISVFSFF